jgi:hypothetical protein
MNNKFIALVKHPVKFRMFLFLKLPSAYFSGVRVHEISVQKAVVTVPFKWFQSNKKISMLVVNLKATYFKKAVDKTYFTCNDGAAIQQTIEQAIITNQSQTITAKSVGLNKAGEPIATFEITWSFKTKTAN